MAQTENLFDVEYSVSTATFDLGTDVSNQVVDLEFSGLQVISEPGQGVEGDFTIDNTLKYENGVLSVNTASVVEANNTLPVTSAAVHVTVGNIEALLNTI